MWVKICGIRNIETALAVAEQGADAVGLNFHEPSPRYVEPAAAAAIVQALPRSVRPVGVFVNRSADDIRRICRETGLETVQLHGDEPASLLEQLTEFRVIRAVRLDVRGPEPGPEPGPEREPERAAEWEVLSGTGSHTAGHSRPWAWLVDARVEGAYGGTGTTLQWDRLTPENRPREGPPLILAGGLTPENVAEAIRIVRPWGVDVASGVESQPGVKDLSRTARFLSAARRASCES